MQVWHTVATTIKLQVEHFLVRFNYFTYSRHDLHTHTKASTLASCNAVQYDRPMHSLIQMQFCTIGRYCTVFNQQFRYGIVRQTDTLASSGAVLKDRPLHSPVQVQYYKTD